MDTRLSTTHGTWQLLLAIIMALTLVMALRATSVSAASPTACRVRNTITGKSYPALQAAVDAASRGDRLAAKGVCHGGTVIDKDLAIEGIRTSTPRAVLDGDGKTRVLLIEAGIRVKVRSLVIRDGSAHVPRWVMGRRPRCDGGLSCGRMGGGIQNRGSLILQDVVVRGNVAGYSGGGIQNGGSLVLKGTTEITKNVVRTDSGAGGGIATVRGRVTLTDDSRVSRNRSPGGGGGIDSYDSIVTLDDNSSVTRNRALNGNGGGISSVASVVTLNDDSSISGNTAGYGGGVWSDHTMILNDTSKIDDNTSTHGGGVAVFPRLGSLDPTPSTLTLNDDSRISGNSARGWGGGVDIISRGNPFGESGGIVTLNDRSSISGNEGHVFGGGVRNNGDLILNGESSISGNRVLRGRGPYGWGYTPNGVGGGVSGKVVLNDSSVVTGNVAEAGGGGVYSIPYLFVCAPTEGANVYGNSPDDCLSPPSAAGR